MAVLWDVNQALRNSVAKGSLADRAALLTSALIAKGKPHPFACWYNPCDSEQTWTIDSAITASIEHSDKKEGAGSLQLINDSVAAEDLFFRPTFTNCADYFGFWLKVIDPPSDFDMWIRKFKTSNSHFEAFHFYVSGGVLYYRPHAWGGYWSNGLTEAMTTDSWYWFQIRNYDSSHDFYVNALLRWHLIMGACVMTDYDRPEGYQTSGKTLGTILLDYWRLATIREYPPT